MATLFAYQQDTSNLLHDSNNLFTSTYTLTRYINQARARVAQDSGCIRFLVAGQSPYGMSAQAGTAVAGGAVPGQAPVTLFQTIAQQEYYPFSYANQTGIPQNAGCKGVCDVQNVAVSWGGAMRPVQNWVPWDQLQARGRSWSTGMFSYPYAWSTSGAGLNNRVWLFPAPSFSTEMEWDCTFLPNDLNTNDDYDAIQAPFDGAVKFWAAKMAFLASFRYEAAQMMETEYWSSLVKSGSATDRSKIPDYYQDYW